MVSWQECESRGLHLTDCDSDGYCNLCGEQESSEWHENCEEDCNHCKKEADKRYSKMAVEIEVAHQKKLWGPGGLLFDPNDPLCQEIVNEESNS